MSTDDSRVSRRGFLRAATGVAAAGAVAGRAAAQEGEARPDWGGWLQGVDGGYRDARGQSEVTVKVGAEGNQGNFAFAPAGLWVDPGTTVKWEWTGEGGGHNVKADSGPASLDSGETVSEAGVHYEHTFESGGITTYFCQPHKTLGMKGAVAVGDDVPTATPTATPTPGEATATPTPESSSGGGGGGGSETVKVGPGGNLVFEPAELEIPPGTTVNFVWESDGHNVVVESQPEGANWEGTSGGASKLYDTGHEYSHTFETEGDYEYFCQPHKSAGMVGTITVSADAGSSGGGGGGPPPVPDSAKTLGIASVIGLASTLGLAYFLMRYGGDYQQE